MVIPVVACHPFLRRSVPGRNTLCHDKLAQPGAGQHIVIELLLSHVHHGKKNELKRGGPVRQRGNR
jgi:hypothetical protein